MKKTTPPLLAFLLIGAVILAGCIRGDRPEATPTVTPAPAPTVTPTPTAMATAYPSVTSAPAPTVTPAPATPTPTAWPSSGPIYTVSCTFSPLILDSTGTVIRWISGNITDIATGRSINGHVANDAYQFDSVSSGTYDLAIDVDYTIYYSNNTTASRHVRLTDRFDVNGNVDEIYPLY